MYTDDPTDYPGSFYSTRVSAHVSWINSVINFQPGNDLRITAMQIIGADCQISLSTGSNRLYRIDHSGNWTTLTNNVVGTGGIVTITDSGGANHSQWYYRAVLLQ